MIKKIGLAIGVLVFVVIASLLYLKIENEILRSKLPKRVSVTVQEKNRLVKFRSEISKALGELRRSRRARHSIFFYLQVVVHGPGG